MYLMYSEKSSFIFLRSQHYLWTLWEFSFWYEFPYGLKHEGKMGTEINVAVTYACDE